MKIAIAIISRRNEQEENEYLLVSTREDCGRLTGFYYPPGGHLEEGESEVDCLRRELKEELGLEILGAEKLAETKADTSGDVLVWYFCRVKSFELNPDKKELKKASFFTREEIEKLKVWPATKKFFREHIKS